MNTEEIQKIVKDAMVAERRRQFKKKILLILGGMFFTPVFLYAASIAIPNTFSDGDTLSAGKLNENFSALLTKVNELDGKLSALEEYAAFADVKPNGSTGGACTAGSWLTRTLNTTVSLNGASISRAANVITLQAGTYYVEISAPGYQSLHHRVKFRNTTDSSDAIMGGGELQVAAANSMTSAVARGFVQIASTKSFEVQHRCNNTFANGFGDQAGFGENEVFTTVIVHRIK